ncbi:MAG: NapC/NirT family cytochrome c [Thermoleophilia bacterium]
MSRWAKYLVVTVVSVAVLVATSFAAAAYTGRSSFCISCHEMQPYDDS